MPRAQRICIEPGCSTPCSSTRCPTHAREYEAKRGTNKERGYDYRFRKASKQAKANATHCDECGRPFTASNPATGGHRRAVRNGGSTDEGIVAQCRECNYGWRRTGL